LDRRPVPQRLVRPLGVVVFDVLTTHVIQVLALEYDQLVEALLLDRLHEPLDVRVYVRRAEPDRLRLHPAGRQRLVEAGGGVLRIPVPQHDLGGEALRLDVGEEPLSLGDRPCRVGFERADLADDAVALAYDHADNTATVTFAGGALADGRYRLTLRGAEVAAATGLALDGDGDGAPGGDYSFEFFVLGGDLTRDATVDFNDLVVLAQKYNTVGKTFAQGMSAVTAASTSTTWSSSRSATTVPSGSPRLPRPPRSGSPRRGQPRPAQRLPPSHRSPRARVTAPPLSRS
jgi:hypothetical protein